MTIARAATADLFAPLPDLTTDVAAGLDLLARLPPVWPVDAERWSQTLTALKVFEERWGGPARACGWSLVQLYGLSLAAAPRADLSRMGAAWLAARDDRRVTTVDGKAITVARLRIFRGEPDSAAVLAWTLCRPDAGLN